MSRAYHGDEEVSDSFYELPKIYSHISDDFLGCFITESEVRDKLKSGCDPVELSLEKWQRIKKAHLLIKSLKDINLNEYLQLFLLFIRSDTCSLCIVNKNKYELESGSREYQRDQCTTCILADVECCFDHPSAYHGILFLLGFPVPDKEKIKYKELLHLKDEEKYLLIGDYISKMIENISSIKD